MGWKKPQNHDETEGNVGSEVYDANKANKILSNAPEPPKVVKEQLEQQPQELSKEQERLLSFAMQPLAAIELDKITLSYNMLNELMNMRGLLLEQNELLKKLIEQTK